LSEPGFGDKEPPPGSPDQAGLRINNFLSEPGFGEKEPPPGTPDQAGLRIKSFLSQPGFGDKEPPPGTPTMGVPKSHFCEGGAQNHTFGRASHMVPTF